MDTLDDVDPPRPGGASHPYLIAVVTELASRGHTMTAHWLRGEARWQIELTDGLAGPHVFRCRDEVWEHKHEEVWARRAGTLPGVAELADEIELVCGGVLTWP